MKSKKNPAKAKTPLKDLNAKKNPKAGGLAIPSSRDPQSGLPTG